MGTYFNPDNQGFRTDIQSRIYIDKTEPVSYTNLREKYSLCYRFKKRSTYSPYTSWI